MRNAMLCSPLMQPRYRLRPEPWLNAVAAVAVGMFIGCWVIGPALTDKSGAPLPSVPKSEPMTYEAMLAPPDPFPYRTATPVFESADQTHYAQAARDKARAEIGGRRAADAWSQIQEHPQPYAGREQAWPNYRVPDRHAVY